MLVTIKHMQILLKAKQMQSELIPHMETRQQCKIRKKDYNSRPSVGVFLTLQQCPRGSAYGMSQAGSESFCAEKKDDALVKKLLQRPCLC